MNIRTTLTSIATVAAAFSFSACRIGDDLNYDLSRSVDAADARDIVRIGGLSNFTSSRRVDDAAEPALSNSISVASDATDTARAYISGASDANGGGVLLPLSERAARAGISRTVAEAWEGRGVFISNTGFVWAETCTAARGVVLPPGVRVAC